MAVGEGDRLKLGDFIEDTSVVAPNAHWRPAPLLRD